jgi:hypothetical protein
MKERDQERLKKKVEVCGGLNFKPTHIAKELVEQKKEGETEVETGLVVVIFPFQA